MPSDPYNALMVVQPDSFKANAVRGEPSSFFLSKAGFTISIWIIIKFQNKRHFFLTHSCSCCGHISKTDYLLI